MYRDPYEKFVLMPVRRRPAPTPIVPRERVQPPPKVKAKSDKAKPDPVKLYNLASSSGWPAQASSVRSLTEVVSKVSGLRISDILGRSHVPDHAKARHIVSWLARRFTGSSAAAIATHIRRKDHTAVLYGVAKVELVIREAPICAPPANEAEAWARALWTAFWPALGNRDPLKMREGQ